MKVAIQSPEKYLYDDDDECGYAMDDNDNRYIYILFMTKDLTNKIMVIKFVSVLLKFFFNNNWARLARKHEFFVM